MTDTNTSGASLAPAADTSAPAASAETTAGNFGSTRGSGLARGKRPSGASAPTGTTAKADYKPTALEVIVPVREYKNPFASQEPENAPAAEPAKVETPAEPVAFVAGPVSQAAPEAPVAAQVYVEPKHVEETESEKAEINILPPADSVRPAVSWESPSAPHSDEPQAHRDDRPTFRPDRREDSPSAPRAEGENRNEGYQRQPRDPRFARQPRDPREARQPRDPRDERQPRDPREARQPRDPRDERLARQPRDPRDENPGHEGREQRTSASQQAPAPKGFLGWLKSLFGGGAKPAPAPAPREGGQEGYGDGQRHRRRHRGGRGHGQGGGPEGFRGEGPQQGGDRQHSGGERSGGNRRRRSRGGSGRDRGSNPRSEGSQGGGAI
ncbi:MAG TPA: translation initiation factor IF-2 [Opitutaceae bacterium]